MYIEEKYIYDQFRNNFLDSKTNPIILYGTGLNTQRLVEKIGGNRIAGLMDEKKTGQMLWGYKVLSYSEAAQINDCIIVIIARNAVINVIYRRIEKFCQENGIPVYDIQGRHLQKEQEEVKELPCFKQREEELKEKIIQHDIISFDIFDTLLMRRILRPRDIYSVMDRELKDLCYCFSKERVKAEDAFKSEDNPDIYEIYKRLQINTQSSKGEVHKLLDKEVELEKRFLVRREKMCNILEWTLQQGKEVYIVSDMYFPKDILEDILQDFGIKGYKDIFISCEYKLKKQEGLFKKYKEKTYGEGKTYLHIGDNYFSDIVAAQYENIDTFQIFSAQEKLECSLYSGLLQKCRTLEENIVLSLLAEKAFNDPFRLCEANGKLLIGSLEEITSLFIAPLICKYIIWLIQGLKAEQCDLVLFPSRDGYLIKKIYDKIKTENPQLKLPEAVYVYTSRRAALVAAAETEADVQKIVDFIFVKDKEDLFKERFGIEHTQGMHISNKMLLNQCKEEQKYYKNYLKQLGLNSYRKIAFMDFVAMGTVQAALEQITGASFEGFYFLRRLTDKKRMKELKCCSLYKEAGDFQIEANVYRFYYFLETVITSYEPTFWGIDKTGNLVFYTEKRSAEAIELIKGIHDEILNYSDILFKLLPDIYSADSGIELYDDLLGCFSADFSELVTNKINCLVNIDEFMGKNVADFNR